jgi:aldehyde dehydrogenase (NAD+)
MERELFPKLIPNWIDGQEVPASTGELFDKLNPHNGEVLCRVARSRAEDVRRAIESARGAQSPWADTPAVKRGDILHDVAMKLREHREVWVFSWRAKGSGFMAGRRPAARPINTP